jgi:acyl-CoA reductase-like NAD-dependent aldehyde dehydrogenase
VASFDEREIAAIVDEVVSRLARESVGPGSRGAAAMPVPARPPQSEYRGATGGRAGTGGASATHVDPSRSISGPGVFATVDEAAEAAEVAFHEFQRVKLEDRKSIIAAMRSAAVAAAPRLSKMAVDETGLGRVEDKIRKNELVALKTPGPEDLRPDVMTGDRGMTLVEWAPWGVILSVTPSTNPTETVINNAIGMVSAGNSVVFNPHPGARGVTLEAINVLNAAIAGAGGPKALLTTVSDPTIETAQALMRHKKTRLLVVTGGSAVVKEAMSSGKRTIGAGPGNPPAVVDETADIPLAAKNILDGASLDNNIICTDEKEIIAVDGVAAKLRDEMAALGVYILSPLETNKLRKVVLLEERGARRHAVTNKAFIGKNARVILAEIGVRVGDDVRLCLAETEIDHPFVWSELLMPIIPMVKVKSADDAIDLAKEVEHGFRHTATMHSRNIARLSRMAREINTSIFVKNGPAFAGLGLGGEGYTSFTIAGPTGEGLTTARTFSRIRRCTLVDYFRIV